MHLIVLLYSAHQITISKWIHLKCFILLFGLKQKQDFINQNFGVFFIFRPVIYLPGKEFSVAVRFSPILYALRPVKRTNGLQNKTQVLSSKANEKNSDLVEEDLKPWEKYQTTFCLPYRMIYAIATQNSIMLYDTQQTEPFARISRIHYIGLNDLTW